MRDISRGQNGHGACHTGENKYYFASDFHE